MQKPVPAKEELFLSVVTPAYNEAPTLRGVAERVLSLPNLLELVIIDDGSTDGTTEIGESLAAENAKVSFIRLEQNSGKTSALLAGFAATRGEVVIVQDADLEYDPDEIHHVIGPIVDGKADVVFGSRFMIKRAARVLYFYHYLANKGLTFLSNLLTNLNLSDVETGYKAFRGDIIRSMVIRSKGFGFEIEVTAKVAKLGCPIYEVPISYYGRTYEDGKKIGYTDGLAALWYIVRFNLFCPKKASFTQLPQLTGSRVALTAGREADSL